MILSPSVNTIGWDIFWQFVNKGLVRSVRASFYTFLTKKRINPCILIPEKKKIVFGAES